MATAQRRQTVAFGSDSFPANESVITFDALNRQIIPLPAVPAANGGTLTTRTSDTQGTATLGEGHTIATGNVVDVYWDGGLRHGMVVGTVSGESVPLTDSGAGDNLPVESTEITVVKQTVVDPLNLDGDKARAVLTVYENEGTPAAKAHVTLDDGDDTIIADHDLVVRTAPVNGLAHFYNIAGGDVNPYSGDPIAKAFASHNAPTAGRIIVNAGINNVS